MYLCIIKFVITNVLLNNLIIIQVYLLWIIQFDCIPVQM